MKKIIILAICVVMATAMVACGNRNAKKNATATEQSELMGVDALLENAENLVGQEIELQDICTHLCSHGATKMFLMGSDESKTLRVEAAKLGSFKQECANNMVKVKGILREERLDEAYLQKWEQDEGIEHHGDGEGGCSTEKAARGETANTTAERIADFRARIAAREQAEGKAYLSFYFIEALDYEII